jgi:cytochrome c5
MRHYLLSLAVAGVILGAAFSVAAQQSTSGAGAAAPAAKPPTAQQAPSAPPGGGSFGANAAAPNPFPDGPGKEIISVACTQCHGPSVFMQLRMNDVAWRNQIYDMILRGAQIGPDDIDTAVKYMVANFGPGVPFPNQKPVEVSLPDGAGKPLVEGGCALCHGLDRVADTGRSKDQWQVIVARMRYFGSPVSDDQASTIIDYLSTNFGPSLKTTQAN